MLFVTPTITVTSVESLVIDCDSIVSCRGSSGQRRYSHPMGQRRAKHPFEDNPFIDGFLEWMGAPEGQQSIEALDLVFAALEHAGVDARQRKIVWADRKRPSIEQSTNRVHAGHPGVPRHLIETHVLGWLENCAPESYSKRQNLVKYFVNSIKNRRYHSVITFATERSP
jgi:hypothetical protein